MADTLSLWSKVRQTLGEQGRPATQRTLLVLFCLVIFVPALFRGFIDPDETRYVEIIREMLENRDWVVPHLNYVPYLLKPPLTYWVSAALASVFGFWPWVLRLVPMLAGIGGVLAAYELGRSLGTRRTGLIAGAVLATSIEYYALSVFFITDMLFSAFLFGAWWAFWRHYQQAGRSRGWIALFWLCAALACFTKGPLGPALLFVSIMLFLALRRDWVFLWRMQLLLGVAVFAAVNLPWMILVYRRDPRFVWFFYWRVNASGAVGAEMQHPERFYYYFCQVPLGFFPWTALAMAAVVAALRDVWGRKRNLALPALVFVTSVFLGSFALLTLARAKLMSYSLPVFCAGAVLTADYIDRLDRHSWMARWILALQSFVAVVGMIVFIIGWETRHLKESVGNFELWIVVPAGLAILAAFIYSGIASLRGKVARGIFATGLAAAVALPVAVEHVPRVAKWRTAQVLCEQFREELRAADLVVVTSADHFSVPLTLQRRAAIVGRSGELGMGLFVQSQPPGTPIPANPFRLKPNVVGSEYLIEDEKLARMWQEQRVIYLFSSKKFLERFSRMCPNVNAVGEAGDLVLSTNRPGNTH